MTSPAVREALRWIDAIIVRAEEGDPNSNWRPLIADFAHKARAALSQEWREPEGWKLVPKEPTEEMCWHAFESEGQHIQSNKGWREPLEAVYRAMLLAAPSPPPDKEERTETCPTCKGKGWVPAGAGVIAHGNCPTCLGLGFVLPAIAEDIHLMIAPGRVPVGRKE